MDGLTDTQITKWILKDETNETKRTNGWINKWTHKQMDELYKLIILLCCIRQTNTQWKNERKLMSEWMNKWIKQYIVNAESIGRVGRWMNGWIKYLTDHNVDTVTSDHSHCIWYYRQDMWSYWHKAHTWCS